MQEMVYGEILKEMPSFLALDISVTSTGYVSWVDGKLELGCKPLHSTNIKEQVAEFSKWLESKAICSYTYFLVEEVITSENFDTMKKLIRLNGVIDDLMLYGRVAERPVIRRTAVQWNKVLYQNTGGASLSLTGRASRKAATVNALKRVGFDVHKEIEQRGIELPKANSYEDIADAMGLALSHYFETKDVTGISDMDGVKELLTDLTSRKYELKQYRTYGEMRAMAEKSLKRSKRLTFIRDIQYNADFRNIIEQFRVEVEDQGSDEGIFLITTPLSKVQYPFLTKGMDVSVGYLQNDELYFTVKKKA